MKEPGGERSTRVVIETAPTLDGPWIEARGVREALDEARRLQSTIGSSCIRVRTEDLEKLRL